MRANQRYSAFGSPPPPALDPAPDPSIIKQKKTLISSVLWLLNNFLPMFRIRIWSRRIRMFLGIPDPHPDPLVNGTAPRIRIRIRTKMSRIPNTAPSAPEYPGHHKVKFLNFSLYWGPFWPSWIWIHCPNWIQAALRIRIRDSVPFWPMDPTPGWTSRIIFPRA